MHARPKGHGRSQPGEAHPRSILSADDVREIRALRKTWGMTMPELAAQFGVTAATIADIVYRRRWRHV